LLYKESGFPPLFAFLHPLSPYTLNSSFLSHIHYFIMASYAEDILRMARDASGPSLRDMEVIRSFQSNPTTKDAVSILLLLFIVMVLISSSFLEWDAHLLGSQSY
jgi:hypothetical protein